MTTTDPTASGEKSAGRGALGERVTLADNRSARWAWMDRFEVPQYDGDGIYLTRWRVIQTPWGGLYVHRMTGPDPRGTLHDHPWPFLSFILLGGYEEDRIEAREIKDLRWPHRRKVRWFNLMRSSSSHSIRRLLRTPTWTVLLVGRRGREWGYWDDLTRGDCLPTWRWTRFDQHPHNDEFVAALARRKAARTGRPT